jgi:hypothetical protein
MKKFRRSHPGFGRTLEQFEKDRIKWQKRAREIAQK